MEKLDFYQSNHGLAYSPESEPWSSLKRISKFRNLIAHAKPEKIVSDETMSLKKFENKDDFGPQSKLETLVTLAFAKRSVQALEEIRDLICNEIDPYDAFSLRTDTWSGSTTVQMED